MKTILAPFPLLLAVSNLASCSYHTMETPIPPASSPPGAGWLTYTNNGYGFRLEYPPDARIAPGATEILTRIFLPFTPGTTLRSKFLDISVQVGTPFCQSSLPYPKGNDLRGDLVIHKQTWLEEWFAESGSEVNADYHSYSAASGRVCLSLNFTLLHATPSTVLPPYNPLAESQIFLDIAETFQWLGGGAVTPTP